MTMLLEMGPPRAQMGLYETHLVYKHTHTHTLKNCCMLPCLLNVFAFIDFVFMLCIFNFQINSDINRTKHI